MRTLLLLPGRANTSLAQWISFRTNMMKHFLVTRLAAYALAILVVHGSAFAQTPLPSPVLVYPLFNSATAHDFISIDDGEVALRPVANATRYDICLKGANESACFFRRMFNASEAVAGANGSLRFFVQIPLSRQNSVGIWTAAACNDNATNPCGAGAAFETFLVLPRQATATAPTGSATFTGTRTIPFAWTNSQFADAGTQLIILRGDIPHHLTGFSGANPTAAPARGMSVQMAAGINSSTVTLIPGLTKIRWAVGTCHNFGTVNNVNKGRRCTARYTTWRSATVPAFFGFAMLPAFAHPRCINCHAVAADNFQNDVPNPPADNPLGGLPSDHPSVNANTNCSSCHANALLPNLGNVNPGWHAPQAGLDFRNRNLMQLCLSAQFGAGGAGGTNAVLNHLNEDRLILWAIGDGRRPGTPANPNPPPLPLAPPGNITTWRSQVTAWVNAGLPCD